MKGIYRVKVAFSLSHFLFPYGLNELFRTSKVIQKNSEMSDSQIKEAKMQVLSNQELSLTLSNELRLKQRLLDEEQKTTDKLIQVSLLQIN